MKSVFAGLLFMVAFWLPPWSVLSVGGMEGIELNTGGHLKIRGRTSWPGDNSPFTLVDKGPYWDGSAEGRVKGEVYFSDMVSFETHYEAVLTGGDTRKKSFELAKLFSGPGFEDLIGSRYPEDNHRLFDLTAVISEEQNRILYHRIDRLALTLKPGWGVVRIGRQVASWGNGMLFNPMDLFNPFAPTDVEREYKIGDDMASVQLPGVGPGDLHVLYVPRRHPQTADVSWNYSSLSAKYHFFGKMTEFTIMAARHYEDYVLGSGAVGYLGSAAWRTDITWTCLDSQSRSDNFISMVANMDYSWVWFQKNFYGFVEFYYSGIGETNYEKAFFNSDIIKRIQRGELYTLGKTYIASSVTAEVHPLFNLHLTAIVNTRDPSGFIQPRAIYDISQNVQILMGADIPWGPKGSEFGGVKIPWTDFTTRSSDSVFLWVSYYF